MNRIVAAAAAGPTPHQTFYAQKAAFQYTIAADRLMTIFGTGGSKPTTTAE